MKRIRAPFLKQWTALNMPAASEDQWYIDLSIRVYDIYANSTLFDNEEDNIHRSIMIGLYMKDVIMQKGGWYDFKARYQMTSNRELPLINISDEYLKDEINVEDILFLNWLMFNNVDGESFFDPNDKESLRLAKEIYSLLDESFEEAPICDHPTSLQWVISNKILDGHIPTLPPVLTADDIKKKKESSAKITSADRCAEYTQLYPLIFLNGKNEIVDFFHNTLQWKKGEYAEEWANRDSLIIFFNTKGMNFSFDVIAYFKDSHNSYYDAQKAQEEGYLLLLNPGACPWDFLNYAFLNGLTKDWKLPIANGEKMLHENWDFIARIYLKSYYDAD